MTLHGIALLPPKVTLQEALDLYKKIDIINMKIGNLNSELHHSIVNLQLVQALALNESVQSTRIEGTQVTFADMIDDVAKRNKRSEVLEVTNYQKALELGIDLIQANNPITSRMIRRLHSELMSNNARGTTSSAGEFRKVPNFIGPTNKIEDAVYIPIDANLIPEYITNLEYYINGESHRTLKRSISSNETLLDSTTNPLLKIGIIHAQFESIHPFLDGNGRMGRILIVLAAMLFGVTDYPLFFVSEQLEKQRIRYYNALNGVRGADPDWYTWLDFFISAVDLMTDELLSKLKRIDDLARKGMQLIGDKSTVKRIWLAMFTQPYATVQEIAQQLNIATSTARINLNKLVDLHLIDVDRAKKKNKVYVNYDLLSILN